MEDNLTKKTVKNSIWGVADVLLRQGLNFVITVILARLLTPSDYGTVGLLMIFISILSIFVDGGFASGLIQKNDRTDDDLCTAFIFNIFIGVGSYVMLFVCAPLVDMFFEDSSLTFLIRVLGIVLIINSFNIVQNAILIYEMRVKDLVKVSATAQLLTGIIAIAMAYRGYGVWALIVQQLFSAVLTTILLYLITNWKPHFKFSMASFQYLWSYGSRVLAARLIGNIFGHVYSFVIGKALGKHELGLFTRSEQFAQQPKNIMLNIISKVLFPALSKCQNDLMRLKNSYIRCTELIAGFIFPLMISLSLLAEPIFNALFGSKWNEAIPLFKILCIGYAVDIFSQLSSYLIQAMGRSDYGLRLEFYKKPIFVAVVFISMYYGLEGIVWGVTVYCVIAALINMVVVKTLLHYSYWKQVKDISKYALLATVVCITIHYILRTMMSNGYFMTIVYCILIVLVYGSICIFFRMKVVVVVVDVINKMHTHD